MYVCLCHKVTDKQIKRAIKDGAENLADISEQLGVATCCGSCIDFAQEVINEALAEVEALNYDLAYQAA